MHISITPTFFFAIIFSLFLYSCAVSSTKGKIHGTVMDMETGSPVNKAWIMAVHSDDNETIFETCSENTGNFEIKDMIHGNYNLTILADDYEIFTVEVSVTQSETSIDNIALKKEKIINTPIYIISE